MRNTFKKLAPYSISESIKKEIVAYLDKGLYPKHILLIAVIKNDLRDALMLTNSHAELDSIVAFFIADAPNLSWGSLRRLVNWTKNRSAMYVQ
jgi:hypothetical protein